MYRVLLAAMKHLLRGLLCLLFILPVLPAQAEPAVARQQVNIRTAPSMSQSQVVGALQAGEEVAVTCSRGWCELADGRGFVATRFLRLGEGGGSAAPAAEPATTATAEPEPEVPEPEPDTGGIFHGVWTARSDAGAADVPLTIQQSGTNALATMIVGEITTTMAGRVDGTRFVFDWENTQGGDVVVAGNGHLNLVGDGVLAGVLMHEGTVLAAMTARR
jgi:hypothetical protein